jgi:3-hydroxybutyryl-CoA dehydrogenase
MEIKKIAVVGAGIMGGGIAQTAAQSGFAVLLEDVNEEYAREGYAKIRDRLGKRAAEGKIEKNELERVLARIAITARIEDCSAADLVIEAAVEIEEVKKKIFRTLDSLCPPGCIFSTNTSCISVTRLAGATGRPERFIGMHFMNPAYAMKLIEVVRGASTSAETIVAITSVAEQMGKVPVVVDDAPGFVSNRVLMPLINEAIFCLEEGVASKERIDMVMKLGANHPMGPLELADFIGLDTCLEILEILRAELGDKFRPSPLLRKMVTAGRLGKKSGEGFYAYR